MGVVNGNMILTPSLFVNRTGSLRGDNRSLGDHLCVSGGTRLVVPARHILSTTVRTSGNGGGMNAANGNVNPACASGMDHANLHMNSVLRGFRRGCTTRGTTRLGAVTDLKCASFSVARMRGA